MGRIEEVEGIFCHTPLHPAPFSVIEVDGDKGEDGFPLPQQAQASGDGHCRLIVTEEVEKKNQQDTFPTVICLHPISQSQSEYRNQYLKPQAAIAVFDAPNHQISDEEGEQHILIVPEGTSRIDGKVKGNLRQQGKEKEGYAVALSIGSMAEAFNEEKAEDWKCHTSDIPEQGIIRHHRWNIGNQGEPCVVNEHGENCNHLQGTVA